MKVGIYPDFCIDFSRIRLYYIIQSVNTLPDATLCMMDIIIYFISMKQHYESGSRMWAVTPPVSFSV